MEPVQEAAGVEVGSAEEELEAVVEVLLAVVVVAVVKVVAVA